MSQALNKLLQQLFTRFLLACNDLQLIWSQICTAKFYADPLLCGMADGLNSIFANVVNVTKNSESFLQHLQTEGKAGYKIQEFMKKIQASYSLCKWWQSVEGEASHYGSHFLLLGLFFGQSRNKKKAEQLNILYKFAKIRGYELSSITFFCLTLCIFYTTILNLL